MIDLEGARRENLMDDTKEIIGERNEQIYHLDFFENRPEDEKDLNRNKNVFLIVFPKLSYEDDVNFKYQEWQKWAGEFC